MGTGFFWAENLFRGSPPGERCPAIPALSVKSVKSVVKILRRLRESLRHPERQNHGETES